MSDPNDLVLLAQELRASKEQMTQTLDALLARVEGLLPDEKHPGAEQFRRYTRKDWVARYQSGGRR